VLTSFVAIQKCLCRNCSVKVHLDLVKRSDYRVRLFSPLNFMRGTMFKQRFLLISNIVDEPLKGGVIL